MPNLGDNDTAMGEPASSHSLGALDRSKRKAASPSQGPASKRPNLEHNNETIDELTPSSTSLPLRRSKRKATSPLQGLASKRPNLEHNNETIDEPTPSPTSLPLRRSKRKIAQRPALKRPHTYRRTDRYITNANNTSTCNIKDFQISRSNADMIAVPIASAPKKSAAENRIAASKASTRRDNSRARAPAAAAAADDDDDRPTRESFPRKRGRAPNEDDDEDRSRTRKRGRVRRDHPEPPPERVVINEAPTQVLDLFVWGSGKYGELGLGSERAYCRECKQPRRNFNMSGNGPGVVHIATGSYHAAVLTKDNRILTWGQNEKGQLGRDSIWEGPATQSGLNPREANGLPVSPDSFPPNTIFTQLACGEVTTFALTNTGDIYGWGSFRIFEREEVADGEYVETDLHKQFSDGVAIQERPVKIPGVKDIKKIVCGDNHVLALDVTGQLYIWGFGDYGQLGHRWSTRVPSYRCLTPSKLRLRREKFTNIGSGSYHSFAIQEDGTVWGWGSNLYGEAGQEAGRIDKIGDGFRIPAIPRIKYTLDILDDAVTDISGGENHTIARTRMGDCLVWGSGQNGQLACDMARVDPDRNEVIIDPIGNEIAGLAEPRAVNRFLGSNPPDAGIVAAGRFHSMAITEDGRLFRWGNNAGWQCGVEKREDDVVEEQDNVSEPKVISGAVGYYNRLWLYIGGGHGYSIAAHATDEIIPGIPRTLGKCGRTGLSPVGEKLPWYLSIRAGTFDRLQYRTP